GGARGRSGGRRRCRRLARGLVAAERSALARARGRRSAARPGGAASGGPAPGDAPLVPRERLDLPDRARGGSRAARAHALRARLLALGTRALLQPGRDGAGGNAGAPGRTAALRVLPGHGADRSGVGRPSFALRRLPLPRPPRLARSLLRGARDPSAIPLEARR